MDTSMLNSYRFEPQRPTPQLILCTYAVVDGGGTIDGNGHYLVTEEIIRRLRKVGLRK